MRRSTIAAASCLAVLALAGPASARDRADPVVVTANQIVDMADARIAQFKADLRLTPDQDRNWGGLQTALHEMAQRRADRMTRPVEQRSAADAQTRADAPRADAPARTDAQIRADAQARADAQDRPDDTVAQMRRQADMLAARADDLRKMADAAAPLYGTLDDRQRERFAAFVSENLGSADEAPGGRRRR